MLEVVVALILATGVGLAVGLLGGGGSILTVPICAYVLGLSVTASIATSLFVVGVTSAVVLVAHARAGQVRWGTGLLFGPAGMAGAFVGSRIAMHVPERVLMILFGAMMATSAWRMLRGPRLDAPPPVVAEPTLARIIALGAAVGLLTGLVGAGGGFVIVPALVALIGLPMRAAIGTSLLVIAMNCAAGLIARLGDVDLDWPLTLGITAVAVAGSLLGARLSSRVPQASLRRGFGWFVVAMAVLVLVRQVA